ncbi:LrgB family protein [Moraxella nasovis]|uniref:LrgB family protein n=1 Tax=Moraxella nasovis TaxID=2904121 RepID=UPI001F60DE55|nr:LrgB family protein [Moraxella nasovis]UNU72930.1 LrgB family protein [Moraxella nasovis]
MDKLSPLTHNPIGLILVFLVVFFGSIWLRGRIGWQLINPTLITTVVMIWFLSVFDVSWEVFNQATSPFTFWLQPAIVCLAVPLYLQWQKIRKQWLPIIISQVIGSIVGIVSGVWLTLMLGGSKQIAVAMAAKSVTMAIAVEVTEKLGGVVAIAAATVLIAGVVGQIIGIGVLRLMHIHSPMAQGVSMGTASHALGTARVMSMGHRYVAYATMGMILNGVLTAFLAPMIVPWIL